MGCHCLKKALIQPNCKITSLDLYLTGIELLGVYSIRELIEQNKQILHFKKITSPKPILENRYIGGESKHSDEPLPQPTLNPKGLFDITSLITARAKTLSDI